MVHLQDLPVELLKHILSVVADPLYEPDLKLSEKADPNAKPRDRNANSLGKNVNDIDDGSDEIEDLRNVCLVSRKFRDLAQPLLFREFLDDGLDGNLSKTILFTKTIYRHPDLGKHVRNVSLMPILFDPNSPDRPTEEDCDLFKGAIRDLQLGDQEQTWISAMEHADFSVFAALLVNKTPNLRGLDLPGGQCYMKPFAALFSRDPSFLSNLESLWIECDDEFSGYPIAAYQELVTRPKLALSTFEYGDLVDASFPSTWAPGTLGTEQVVFLNCHLDVGALRKFMQACKKLKSFTYQNFNLSPHEQRTPSLSGTTEFNAAQAHEAALLHKDTLEHFHLEFSRRPWDIEDVEKYLSSRAKIGSFRDFSVLNTMTLPHAVLPTHPQFPPSIEALYITDCNSSIRSLVQLIAKDCKNGLYPKLTEFKVLAIDITEPIKLPGRRVPQGKTPEQCFRDLQKLFEGTTVDFQILPYRMPELDDYDDYDDEDDEDEDDEDDEDFGLGAGPPGLGQMPGLFNLLMQRALQDPDFAHLRR